VWDILLNVLSFLVESLNTIDPIIYLSFTCKDCFIAVRNLQFSGLLKNVKTYNYSIISETINKCYSLNDLNFCKCWIKHYEQSIFLFEECSCEGNVFPQSKLLAMRCLKKFCNNNPSFIEDNHKISETNLKHLIVNKFNYLNMFNNLEPSFDINDEVNNIDITKYVMDYIKSYGITSYNDYLKINGVPELKSIKHYYVNRNSKNTFQICSSSYFKINDIFFNVSIKNMYSLMDAVMDISDGHNFSSIHWDLDLK